MGRTWRTREELSNSWVHRPKSANFHAGARGVYSVLINSKHRGVDNGFTITYASMHSFFLSLQICSKNASDWFQLC